ncbi:hypothetical protein ACH5RR_028972 [Cinchona calisaya]|uniref:Bulb-type lectin domain-containing protein n=1 Tax=Cinchona calisaya TaxID=153742 RepID=A0ABD2YQB0_9GENT
MEDMISEDGNLKLLDKNRTSYFSTKLKSSLPFNRTLKLLDSGNMALIDDQSGKYLWKSFAQPIDTLLLGMKMDEKLKLVSWMDSSNLAVGNFTFQQDQDNRYKIINGLSIVHWKGDVSGPNELPYFMTTLLSNFSCIVDQVINRSSIASVRCILRG